MKWYIKASSDLTHLWKVGQPVRYYSDEFGGSPWHKGVVTEVYTDHVIVSCPDISDHLWFEPDFNLDQLYPEYNF